MQETTTSVQNAQNFLPTVALAGLPPIASNVPVPNPNSGGSVELGHHLLSWIVNLSGLPVSKENVANLYNGIKEYKILLGGILLLGIFLMRHKIRALCKSFFADEEKVRNKKERNQKVKSASYDSTKTVQSLDIPKNSRKNTRQINGIQIYRLLHILKSAKRIGIDDGFIGMLHNSCIYVTPDLMEVLSRAERQITAYSSRIIKSQIAQFVKKKRNNREMGSDIDSSSTESSVDQMENLEQQVRSLGNIAKTRNSGNFGSIKNQKFCKGSEHIAYPGEEFGSTRNSAYQTDVDVRRGPYQLSTYQAVPEFNARSSYVSTLNNCGEHTTYSQGGDTKRLKHTRNTAILEQVNKGWMQHFPIDKDKRDFSSKHQNGGIKRHISRSSTHSHSK